MRAGSFEILPVTGSRRVSVGIEEDVELGLEGAALGVGAALDGAEGLLGTAAGAGAVVPGLVVDAGGVTAAGRSEVVAGRSGFVV
jgi:hypothetical protein